MHYVMGEESPEKNWIGPSRGSNTSITESTQEWGGRCSSNEQFFTERVHNGIRWGWDRRIVAIALEWNEWSMITCHSMKENHYQLP